MSKSICGCGIQAGYPHKPDCPRPYFQGSDADWATWQKDRAARKLDLAAMQEYEYLCAYARANGDMLALKNAVVAWSRVPHSHGICPECNAAVRKENGLEPITASRGASAEVPPGPDAGGVRTIKRLEAPGGPPADDISVARPSAARLPAWAVRLLIPRGD